LFDWEGLAAAGIGCWPNLAGFADRGTARKARDTAEVQSQLARFGYEAIPTGILDDTTRSALAAFQRHFRPARIDGEPDGATRRRLAALLEQTPPT
jgi:N-acetylmuramoyl-L-alanine amidase